MSPQMQQAEKRIMTSPDFFLAHSIPHMPQRRNGDESPSCGVCSRRARLKLTAPTATLDTPSPISSTESTKRLPMIWPLVHILLGSSFLPAQRWKLIIYLLSFKVLFSPFRPLPQSSSSNFSFFTSKTLSKGSGFPEPENHFRGGAREDRADPARGAFTRGPRAMGGSPEAFTEEPGSGEQTLDLSLVGVGGAVQSSAASLLCASRSLPHLSGSLLLPGGGTELGFLAIKGSSSQPLSARPLAFPPLFSCLRKVLL